MQSEGRCLRCMQESIRRIRPNCLPKDSRLFIPHQILSIDTSEMINLVLSGLTPSYLSTYCGDSKRTITLWVKIADEQGFEALKTRKPTGRPSKLTKEQKAEIRAILEEDNPKKYGHNVWDGPSLSAYVEKTYAVKLSVRQCQRLFHSLGFSLVRPQTFPSKGEHNEQERAEYIKTQ